MILCKDIVKDLGQPPQRILHGLSFQIGNGEFISISGRSGSGKSTLLYLISTLDLPTSGTITIDGNDIAAMSIEEIHRFRNQQVGFIFQFHYLLSELTALENILLPARNLDRAESVTPYAYELLQRLGIEKQAHKFPSQMSGGEQQRTAIARALIMKPKYLFADEPTGNLDTKNAQTVMGILRQTHEQHGTTVCLVTHDPQFASIADREIYLIDGRIGARTRADA